MLLHIVLLIQLLLYVFAYNELSDFVKTLRKAVDLTQEESADRVGVALTVIQKIEQNKANLNLDKVNQVLKMFGHKLMPVSLKEL